jgi:hypothetical protein
VARMPACRDQATDGVLEGIVLEGAEGKNGHEDGVDGEKGGKFSESSKRKG